MARIDTPIFSVAIAGEEPDVANERRCNVCIGQIVVDGAPTRCKVRHLTGSSAIIQTPDAPFVPAAFGLRIPSVGLDINCSVVWRDERRLGVTFF